MAAGPWLGPTEYSALGSIRGETSHALARGAPCCGPGQASVVAMALRAAFLAASTRR